jgi:DNA invertase Pin-like site-specific DNA recombinase
VATYDIYTRVSDEDGRSGPSFGSPDEQEAVCRAWIEREGADVGEVVYDGNVSGAKPVDERELGRLIRRVEDGESAGIVVRYIDRFGRDMVENGMALKRIETASGRLVAPDSGFDSKHLNAESRMVYNILSAVAEAVRERNLENRKQGIRRAADRGVYLASNPPGGYDRREGKLSMQSKAKKLVREAYRRRADGQTFAGIAEWLRGAGADVETVDEWQPSRNRPDGKRKTFRPFAAITENGARQMLSNRAYLGEVVIPGEPEPRTGGAWAILTHAEWERAQAAGGHGKFRNNGKWSSQTRLHGLVYCRNGHRLKSGAIRTGKESTAAYLCTHPDCDQRAAIGAQRLDDFVEFLLMQAATAHEPHIAAVLEGDSRYSDALAAVEAARLELEAFVTEVKITDLGKEAWLDAKASRQAALDAARAELRATPAPPPVRKTATGKLMMFAEAYPGLQRDNNARFIQRIVVQPVGRGRRVPVEDRVEVYYTGAEEPADLSLAIAQGDAAVPAVAQAAA